jgi:hypothetical protein
MTDFPMIPRPSKFSQWYSQKLQATQFQYELDGLELTFRFATIKDLVATGVIPIPLIDFLSDEVVKTTENGKPENSKERVAKYFTDVAKSKELLDNVVKSCLVDPLELKDHWELVTFDHLEAIYTLIINGGAGATDLKSPSG